MVLRSFAFPSSAATNKFLSCALETLSVLERREVVFYWRCLLQGGLDMLFDYIYSSFLRNTADRASTVAAVYAPSLNFLGLVCVSFVCLSRRSL